MKAFREESGFTLVEALIAMLVMVTVMFALYAIFDAGIRVFRFSNDKTEAVETARIGMERMEREIRAAYPYSRTSEGVVLFPSFGPNPSESITFGNDLNGNGAIGSAISGERIEYRLDSEKTPPELVKNGNPLVLFVPPGGLAFTYLDEEGNPAAEERGVRTVRIELTIDVEGRTQTLTTDVALRNRAD